MEEDEAKLRSGEREWGHKDTLELDPVEAKMSTFIRQKEKAIPSLVHLHLDKDSSFRLERVVSSSKLSEMRPF